MLATKSATHAATAESTTQVTASESPAASESSAASMTAAAAESSASSMATGAATTDLPGGQGVRPHCCAERDGDEEDHELASDWLLLDAGR
jgi:hypothetical protein